MLLYQDKFCVLAVQKLPVVLHLPNLQLSSLLNVHQKAKNLLNLQHRFNFLLYFIHVFMENYWLNTVAEDDV